MQIQQHQSQLIEEFKMNDSLTLFSNKDGTLVDKLCEKEQLKEFVIVYIHKNKELLQKEITITFNAIIVANNYLELSKCYFDIKLTKTKNSDGVYVITLFNASGKEFIITSNQSQFIRIQIFLKRFCINKNFQGKYQLIEQKNCLPLFQSFKNNEQHCVQIFDKKSLKDSRDYQIFHNLITITHALQLAPNIVRCYEDNQKFYLICQNMKLQTLESLLLNGFEFKEVPFVSIIFMILQTLQKYQNKGIYHGNINLQSVFINVSSPILQIAVLYPKFHQESELNIESDIQSLALLLYQITFYNQREPIRQYIDHGLIEEMMIQQHQSTEKSFKYLYRVSQLDLLKQLSSPGITLERALRHQWFVTIKQNLKLEQNNKNMHKFNLNTILESSNELSMTNSQLQDQKHFTFNNNEPEPEEEFPVKSSVQNQFMMIPSKVKHDKAQQFQYKSKTFSNFDVKRGSLLQITKQPTLQ